MSEPIDPFLLSGTRDAEAKPLHLKAGGLSVELSEGNLRAVRYDGVEVLRAVSYLIRDRDWGTYNPSINDLTVERRKSGFSVSYQAQCKGPDKSQLTVDVHIVADESGLLEFDATAHSDTGFETNRCGFCILHPIIGLAGSHVMVEHVDGNKVDTHLPDLIEPWQPFKDMRAITHEVIAGVAAECRMEGDIFEMEDQRNWSDASYKTYVRPLALPWPYEIEVGKNRHQRIVLNITDQRAKKPEVSAKSNTIIHLSHGEKCGNMPAIGLIITPEEAAATLESIELLQEIAPQNLLFHFDPLAGHDSTVFINFAAVAALHKGHISLEIALPCANDPVIEAQEIAAQMHTAGFKPDAIMVSPAIDRQSTPPGSEWPPCPPLDEIYKAARTAFPNIKLGGGMLSYFTELNRKRVPSELIDFVSHCTNPIVHAADDLSVMQTLEALPFITRSVRGIYGDKPYRIGPSTIPMRQNPYGSRTMDNPDSKRIAMANRDPRHNGKFGEAFAFAYAICVLDAQLDCLTLSALTGPFGLIAGESEPVAIGGKRPLFQTIKKLAGLAGRQWRECISTDGTAIIAFTVDDVTMVVNITNEPKKVQLEDGNLITLPPYSVYS